MSENALIPQNNSDLTALQSIEQWALQLSGTPSTFPISTRRAQQLPAAMRAAQAQLQPATAKQMAVEIAGLVSWARAFNIPAPDVETAVTAYREALKHLPPDLLSQAFQAVMATHKYGMRLPLPSELSKSAQEEFTRRLNIRTGLFLASRLPIEDKRAPVTEAEKQAVSALLSKWRTQRSQAETTS